MKINNKYEITETESGWKVKNIQGRWSGEFATFKQAWAFVFKRLLDRSAEKLAVAI